MNKNSLIRTIPGETSLFLLLFTVGLILHIFLYFMAPVDVSSPSSLTWEEQMISEKSDFISEDKELKFQTTLGIGLLLLLCAGLSINFFILFFLMTNRKQLRNFFFPENNAPSPSFFQTKDLIYFFIFGFFIIQIFRSLFFILKTTGIMPPRMIFQLNLLSGTLGVQLIAVSFIIFYALRRYRKKPAYFQNPFKDFFQNALKTFLIFLGVLPWTLLFTFIGFTISQKMNISLKPHIVSEQIARSPLQVTSLYLIIFAVLGAPFFEEFLFRGFIQSTLKKKWGLIISVLATAFIFSIFHMNFLQFFYIFGLGFSLSLIYESTSNLWFPIFCHMLNNLAAITLTLLLK